MRFVDYILSHTATNTLITYLLFNPLLGAIVSLLKGVLESLETLLNASFAMFSFIYSPQVIEFIRPWIGWLWVPIAIAIFVLGINLIINNNDIIEKGVHKKFIQNFCLLLVVVFLLPVLFIGTNKGANSNLWAEGEDGSGGKNGIISIFTDGTGDENAKSPFWDSLSGITNNAIGGSTNNTGSQAEKIISQHIVDLQYVYLKYAGSGSGKLSDSSWSENVKINDNCNSYISDSKGVWDDIGSNLSELINKDKIEGMLADKIKNINELDPRSDGTTFLTLKDDNDDKNIKHDILDPFGAGISKPSSAGFSDYDDNCEVDGATYLFYSRHAKHTWGSGDSDYTYTSNSVYSGFFDWEPSSEFPYRYSVDWGVLIVDLLIQCIIIIGMSFKIVSIIFELAFSQFFAIFAATTDLTNGQRTKEALKIIFSLVLTIAFSGVLYQFYVLGVDYIGDAFSENSWIRLLFTVFLGIACIKGTTILQRVLGVDNGGVGKALGAIAGAGFVASRVAKTGVGAVKAGAGIAASTAKWTGNKAAKIGGAVSGKVKARKEAHSIGTQGGISSRKVKSSANKANGATAGIDKPNGENGFRDADAQQYVKDNLATIQGEHADRMSKYEKKHSRPWRSDGTEQGSYEQARKAAGYTQGNIIDDAMRRMSVNPNLGAKDAINNTLKDAGYSSKHADLISSEMAESGAMDKHKSDLNNQISELAQSSYLNANGNNIADGGSRYDLSGNNELSQGECYREAAAKVLSDRGIESKDYADTLGNSVCARDNYGVLNQRANDIRGEYNAMHPNKGEQMSVEESFTRACEESSFGISGEVDKKIYAPAAERALSSSSGSSRSYQSSSNPVREYRRSMQSSMDRQLEKQESRTTHYSINRKGTDIVKRRR